MAGKKTAMLVLGVLLLVGMIFAGSASADDAVNSSITTWNELKENITNWNGIGGNGMLTIVLDTTIESDAAGPNDEGITVSRNITITSSSGKDARIDADQKGRIFTIDSTGNLTLRGNGSSMLSLTGGMLDDYFHSGGAIYLDGGRLLILPGAEITNCSSLLRGGAVYADRHAEVILDGGKITGCRNLLDSGGGAAVYVNESSFTISSGIIANCSSLHNGGAVYASDSTVLMDNGTIMNCSAVSGGGLFIYDSRFTLNKGIIVDCRGDDGGGLFVYAGTSIMNDGNITGCNADNMGGAVYVDSDSEFSMNGGTISDSTAGSGGGVLSYGRFTMDGGIIMNCSAPDNGGGAVYLISSYPDSCTFTLKDGTIVNCSAAYGGGIYMNGGVLFTLNAGTIPGCTAEEQGGAVYVYDTSSFDMKGGTIADCTATYEGGGVYVSSEGRFNVSGGATITSVTKSGSANNVFLGGDSCLNLVGPFTGIISITYPEGAAGTPFGTFVSGSEDDAKNFLSDTPGYFGRVNGTNLEWTPINTTVPVVDGKAVFGGTNTTVLSDAGTSPVASVVLEDVSKVVGTVAFKASASADDPVPATSGYTKIGDVSIFNITATLPTGGTAYINISLIFKEEQDRDIVRFWHYGNGNWEARSGTPIADLPNKITYCVPTDAFSPFAISLETPKTSPYVPSHSRQSGSTVILQDGGVAPTATPTAEPAGNPTLNPTVKPTQPTQKSPAPFVGILVGLGAALVFTRLRK